MAKSKVTKPKLLDDSSSDSEVGFKINNSYATAYDKWRSGEELQKLKDKYGSDVDTDSSSESDEEVPIIEKDFLKTLSLLKSKDPQIYDENVRFFEDEGVPKKKAKEKKSKPLYPKDYERKMLLETNGELSESDDGGAKFDEYQSTYDKEQEEIRKSFRVALQDFDSDDEDGNEELLRIRKKDQKKKEEEELDYIEWLKGQKDDIEKKEKSDLAFLHKHWNDPKLDDDERFLKDYILNKKYLDEDSDNEDIPTYDEITGTLSEDEQLLEKQEIFEHKYNFRFEEPDEEFIKKYPRTVAESLRRKDNKRKQKREDYQERKKREKEQKREEIRQLKALKRKEIEEKLNKLRETVGNEQLPFNDLDVEGDFDPDEHDRKMQQMFSDNFYDVEEPKKPEFGFDEELDNCENWDNWTGDSAGNDYQTNDDYYAPHCEDPDFNMDADYDPKTAFQQQMLESSMKKNRRHRRKSKFAEMVEKSKPVFDGSSEKYDKYINEYYKLDCEDVIGDLPVRFKYHSVVPNDFGLTPEEIWASKDKELNHWCSMKKVCGYRKEEEELYDVQAFRKKAWNEQKKRKIFLNYFAQLEGKKDSEEEMQNPSTDVPKKKKKQRKKKRTAIKSNAEDGNDHFDDSDSLGVNKSPAKTNQPEFVNDVNKMIPEGNEKLKKTNNKRKLDVLELETKTSKKNKTTTKDLSLDVETSEHADESMIKENVKCKKKKKKNKNDPSMTSVMKCEPLESISEQDVSASRNCGASDKLQSTLASCGGSEKKWEKRENNRKRNNWKNQNVSNNNEGFNSPRNNTSKDKRLLIPDSRLKMYGINPKKFRNRLIYGNKQT